tara:strand:+ start:115 stop:885 length:771 start_codon:yes stop_codon:yes gene_type:complete
MSITKRYDDYIKTLKEMKLSHTNSEVDAIESVDDVVTLPKFDEMSDDEVVEEAKRLCAAVEEKLNMRPPRIAEKMAERMHIGATTYSNYRRGICVLSSQRRRRGSYSCVREILAVYLNTGDVNNLMLPTNDQKQEQHDKAVADQRLTDIEKRIKANNTQFKSWKTRTANAYDTTMSKLQAAIAEQQDQRVRLNKAIGESVRLDKRIDFVDNAQHELLIKAHNRLDGLAEANKHLLEKLEAAATAAATPWWKRWMAK